MKNTLIFSLLLILAINGGWKRSTVSVKQKAAKVVAEEELKFVDGLPDDLNTSKVIFLKYDMVKVDAKDRKAEYYQKKHNKNVPDANAELAEAAKKYPFEYTIASRKDIEKLKGEGYKYVLDSQAYINMAAGFRQDESHSITQGQTRIKTIIANYYQLYFEEIGANTAYVVSEKLTENQLYFPKFVMNNMVLKSVNKKFK